MDPMALAGMLFVLVLIAMVGGFILLIPISRRLGRVLDAWLLEKRGRVDTDELIQLRQAVQTLEAEVSALAERQQFTDRLLESRSGEKRDG